MGLAKDVSHIKEKRMNKKGTFWRKKHYSVMVGKVIP